jgi:hypothetical protein
MCLVPTVWNRTPGVRTVPVGMLITRLHSKYDNRNINGRRIIDVKIVTRLSSRACHVTSKVKLALCLTKEIHVFLSPALVGGELSVSRP